MRILGAALALLLLAGCTAPPVIESVETPSQMPTPSGYLISVSQPPQIFGGLCATLKPGSEWLLTADDGRLNPVDALVPNNGGLRCTWTNSSRTISVVMLPTSAAEPVGTSCGEEFDGAPTSCAIEAVSGGIRLSGHALGSDTAQAAADRDEVLALFAAAVPADVRALEPQRDATAWPDALDCTAITEAADLPTATGLDAEFVGEAFALGYGSDAYVAPAEQELRAHGNSCGVYGVDGSDTVGVLFTTLGGGRWMEAEVRAAKGARVVNIDGLQLVVLVPSPVYGTTVNVFDGVNWLQTTEPDDERAYAALAALVAVLN